MKKTKKNKVVIGALLIMVGIALAFILWMPEKEKIETDAVRFAEEYTMLDEENVFVYKTAEEIINILEKGTGIVYLGFPECPWCQKYVVYLNEVAKENNVEKINYYNILEDRSNNTENYQKIVSILGNNLLYDDEGNYRIFVPDVTIVKNGTIIAHDNETSVVHEDDGTPDEYWTEEKVSALKSKFNAAITKMNEGICTTCEKDN